MHLFQTKFVHSKSKCLLLIQYCHLQKKLAWTGKNLIIIIILLWQQESLSHHICVLHLAGSVCIAPRKQPYLDQQHGWQLVWSEVPIATWNWCGEHLSNTSMEPVKSMMNLVHIFLMKIQGKNKIIRFLNIIYNLHVF